ncbi:MAG: shikimate dehydrogenase [Proteobacteria bacterium]|nr:shikimate dehydrogenase [Pseudomonadota bacterium]
MHIVSAKARVAGIAGWPVSHSRSPRIHGFWLDHYGIDGAYVPLPVEPASFIAAMRGLRAAGFAGANVTVPHKLAAFALCDRVDDSARRAGAVNTLIFKLERIEGSNSDGFGFLAGLRDAQVDATAGPALILGAGGAARAVAAALLDLGVAVSIANRTPERAVVLARELPGLRVVGWDDRSAVLGDHALLVNSTTLGMGGQGDPGLAFDGARSTLVVADLVYVPLETPLLAAARRCGLRTIDGLGMLLHQARPGFAAWFGIDPVVDAALRAFVLADLPPA